MGQDEPGPGLSRAVPSGEGELAAPLSHRQGLLALADEGTHSLRRQGLDMPSNVYFNGRYTLLDSEAYAPYPPDVELGFGQRFFR